MHPEWACVHQQGGNHLRGTCVVAAPATSCGPQLPAQYSLLPFGKQFNGLLRQWDSRRARELPFGPSTFPFFKGGRMFRIWAPYGDKLQLHTVDKRIDLTKSERGWWTGRVELEHGQDYSLEVNGKAG